MKLIILTRACNGSRVYVNPNQICCIYRIYEYDDKETTAIRFAGEAHNFIDVKERPEVIEDIIKAEKEK